MSGTKPIESLSTRLKKAIAARNMTRSELEKLSGLSSSMISDYYNGKATPRQNSLIALASALRVSPSWLLGYDISMEPTSKEIKAEDVFTFDGTKITGQEILDLINEKIKKSKEAK